MKPKEELAARVKTVNSEGLSLTPKMKKAIKLANAIETLSMDILLLTGAPAGLVVTGVLLKPVIESIESIGNTERKTVSS